MKTIATIITVIMAIAAVMALRGYVVAKLWLWFVAAAFGLPSLGIAQAAGLSLIIEFLTSHEFKRRKSGETSLSFQISMAFVMPPLALLFGWITKQCL